MSDPLSQRAIRLQLELRKASPQSFADRLLEFLQEKGGTRYDEAVTQMEHGLQAAWLARQTGASPSLVVAALFHDLGHLLMDEFEGRSEFLSNDLLHERIAASFLEAYMPQEVLDAIRLHVPAKRYLCFVDPSYLNNLSPASRRSFALQGGVMSDHERQSMETEPFLDSALQLRRWDDLAKIAGKAVPALQAYHADLMEVRLLA